MASTVTNRSATKNSYLVGQAARQSSARSLLVEAPGSSTRREIPHSIRSSGGEVEDSVEKGGKSSIIDLAQSPITGPPWAPRGQPIGDSYETVIKDSENKKWGRSPEVCTDTVETSQESEPIRSPKRRKRVCASEESYSVTSSSPIQPANKRRKRFLAVASAQNLISNGQDLPLSQKDEIEDSYEASGTAKSSPFTRIVVEIPVYEHFDRDAYAIVSVSSTQSSSIAQLETPYYFPEEQRHPSPSRFSEVIIPDSQELLGGSSIESSKCDATRRLSVNRAASCIPNSSNIEDRGAIVEASSQFRVSSGACSAHSVPSVTQNSASNSTESWQGAQIVTSLDISASQTALVGLDFQIFQDETEDRGGASQKERSQDTRRDSILSQRDANSQRSGSQTKVSQSASPKSQNKCHPIEAPITEDNRARGNSEEVAEGESFVTPERPFSPHLNLPYCVDMSDINPPQGPHTPSNSEMAESVAASASSKMSYAEMAMQARDKVRVRYEIPAAAANFDPSSSLPAPNTSHQMLPVRENITGMPPLVSMEENLDDDEQPSETAEVTLRLPPMKPTDHVILLPLAAMVRKVYNATLTRRRREMMAFVNNEEIDPKLLEQIDAMVEELKILTDHQDLIADMSLTQSNLPDEHQAKWAETCSTKCLFLRHFLDCLRKDEKHVAILARPGRMLDILESILKVNGFTYERPDRPSRSNNRAVGPLTVTLLPTGLLGTQYVVNRADAVIAFDETFRMSESYSRILRQHLYDPEKLSPLISLVVAYSAEHLDLCLPKFNDPIERKMCLVNFIAQRRERLGDLDEGLLGPQEAAATVARHLRFDGSPWPLPPNPDITGLEVQQQQIQSGLISQSRDQELLPLMATQGSAKRTLRAESISGPDVDSTKRMRMTPTRGEIMSSGDVTRVSDTVGHRTQVPQTSTSNTAYEAIAKVDTLDEEQAKHISSLLEKVDNLEVEVQKRQGTEEQLRSLVKNLEARLDDYVSTIKKLEPKLLQSIADRRKFQAERDAAKSRAAILTQSIEARVNEITRLKEDKANIEKDLATARTDLTNSTVPEIAQLAQTQEQLRTLQADKERLEKRILSMQKDFEFTRDSYQKASSYTTELRNEVSELQGQNAILQRKASENTVRVAEIQRANEAKEREERIDELEAVLRDRDQELRKKTEELKIKTNGRRETRGTSVPRSPRMGSGAMSPRPRFAQPAGGSRGGSPAPGDARDGFRDATLFPSSALASARWGHLNDR